MESPGNRSVEMSTDMVCEDCGEVYCAEAEGGQECPECGVPGG